mgnify:CR=1 FL=1
MNKLFKIHWLAALCGLTMLSLTACNDDDNPENKSTGTIKFLIST